MEQKKTNFDRIKDMDIHQMAKFLAREIPHGDCCDCLKCLGLPDALSDSSCEKVWLLWLEERVDK